MDIYEAMSTQRAIRRLRPDEVPNDALERALEAATWAPTGANAQPWRAVVVRDRETMATLGAWYAEGWFAYAEQHSKAIENAPAAIRDATLRMMKAGDYLAEHFAATPVLVVFCFNPKLMVVTDANESRQSVVGGASVYPAVQNFMLGCRNEGLGCVLTTLLCHGEARVRALLEIPDPWYTAAAVPVGYSVGGGYGPVSRRPVAKMAYADRWGAPG